MYGSSQTHEEMSAVVLRVFLRVPHVKCAGPSDLQMYVSADGELHVASISFASYQIRRPLGAVDGRCLCP